VTVIVPLSSVRLVTAVKVGLLELPELPPPELPLLFSLFSLTETAFLCAALPAASRVLGYY